MNFENIKGFEQVKRALEVAAVGSHPVLLIGGMGSGKTMAAEAVKTITGETVVVYEDITEVARPWSTAMWKHITANTEMIICTTLPCPCGQLLGRSEACTCPVSKAKKYWDKLIGISNIPIQQVLHNVTDADLNDPHKPESSMEIRNRVLRAQAFIDNTYGGTAQSLSTEKLKQVKAYTPAWELLDNAYTKLSLTLSQQDNIIKVAISIAALQGKTKLDTSHIAEAIQYQRGYDV